jgi:hypothetical protein
MTEAESIAMQQRRRLETRQQSIIEHLRRGWLPDEFKKHDRELTGIALEIADLWQ